MARRGDNDSSALRRFNGRKAFIFEPELNETTPKYHNKLAMIASMILDRSIRISYAHVGGRRF